MRLSVIFKIAFKNLMGKKTRSVLTIGGVMVGIGAIVFLVSLAYGVQYLIVERATGLDALRIIDVSTVKSKVIKLNDDAVDNFKGLAEIDLVEALVNMPGKINYGGSATDVVIFATTPEYLEMASVKVDQGSYYEEDEEGMIVNTAVLNLIGVSEQNYTDMLDNKAGVDIIIQKELLDEEDDDKSKTVTKELKIVGIIDDADTPYLFIPLKVATGEGVVNYSQAKVKMKDATGLEDLRQKIEAIGFSTSSAADTVEQINSIFSIFRIILGSFGAIALGVAAIGMFNTLTVSLLERTREVGLMKALGVKKKEVFILFLSESFLISLIGGLLGIAFGWFAGESVNFILAQLARSTGNEAVDIFTTPVAFVGVIIVFSMVVGFVTGIYPSRRASSLNPLDALRYE